jgi:hypothetical protein
MTDPTYKPEPVRPAPREDRINEVLSHRNVQISLQPTATGPRTSTPRTQLEQDELLARQLAGEGRPRSEARRC